MTNAYLTWWVAQHKENILILQKSERKVTATHFPCSLFFRRSLLHSTTVIALWLLSHLIQCTNCLVIRVPRWVGVTTWVGTNTDTGTQLHLRYRSRFAAKYWWNQVQTKVVYLLSGGVCDRIWEVVKMLKGLANGIFVQVETAQCVHDTRRDTRPHCQVTS